MENSFDYNKHRKVSWAPNSSQSDESQKYNLNSNKSPSLEELSENNYPKQQKKNLIGNFIQNILRRQNNIKKSNQQIYHQEDSLSFSSQNSTNLMFEKEKGGFTQFSSSDSSYEMKEQLMLMKKSHKSSDVNSSMTFGSSGAPKSKTESKPMKTWFLYTIAATLAFTLCNLSMCVLTHQHGMTGILYFSTGTVFCGAMFFLVECWNNHIQNQPLLPNFNLKSGGKLDQVNVLAYMCFCLIYQINQLFAFMTMYFAQRACLNKGVVSILWSLNPLFIAIYDLMFYGTKLSTRHFFGIVALISASLAIGLSSIYEPILLQRFEGRRGYTEYLCSNQEAASWWAVFLALITPIGFAANAIYMRFMVYELKFDAKITQFSSASVMGSVNLVCAGIFWHYQKETDTIYEGLSIYKFSMYSFYWGFGGSIINILGIVCLQLALTQGPAGPISAFVSFSNVMLAILEYFFYNQSMRIMELYGLGIGLLGILILVIPEMFESILTFMIYIFSCKCCKNIISNMQMRLKYTKWYKNEQRKKKHSLKKSDIQLDEKLLKGLSKNQ